MELSKQVTSLEISKKLKDLGVKQDSLFFYEPKWSDRIHYSGQTVRVEEESFSAFTASELGELLPLFEVRKKGHDYYRAYSSLTGDDFMADEETQVEAMGKLLIYLLENKLITI